MKDNVTIWVMSLIDIILRPGLEAENYSSRWCTHQFSHHWSLQERGERARGKWDGCCYFVYNSSLTVLPCSLQPWESQSFCSSFPYDIVCGDSWGQSLLVATDSAGVMLLEGENAFSWETTKLVSVAVFLKMTCTFTCFFVLFFVFYY